MTSSNNEHRIRYLTINQVCQRLGGISRQSLFRYRGKGEDGRKYKSMGPDPALYVRWPAHVVGGRSGEVGSTRMPPRWG